MSNLAFRMAAAMKAAGFNQPRLAKAASTPNAPVSQQVVQHLLSGRNKTSGHLPAIAEALDVSLDWLATGRGESDKGGQRAEALLIGTVGTDGEIDRLSVGPVLAGVVSPSGVDGPNMVVIGDDFQAPFQEGWLVFYGPEHKGVPDDCLGKLCVVQVKNGPTILKTLQSGSRKGVFRFKGRRTAARNDLKIVWAARVTAIIPR